MVDVNILIADNDTDALKIYREYLESLDYKVITASTAEAAREILNTQRVHLAIIDLRLTDDSEGDRSGLSLAREVARTTPKLILTKWPTYRDVREALRLDNEVLPPAIDFLNKEDGLAALGAAVMDAVEKYVRINRDLIIQLNDAHPVSFLNLIGLVAPQFSKELQQQGAEEIEDLFRRLFYEKNEIKIDRLLWQRDGRAALVVFAFIEGHASESLVVVCGSKERMDEGEQRYREFAPPAPGRNSTVLNQRAATPHFAAHGYALAGADLGDATSLEDLYRTAPTRTIAAVLGGLFDETLTEWHQTQRVPVAGKSLAELYGAMLGLGRPDQLRETLEDSLEAIVRRLPALGAEVQRLSGKLVVKLGARTFSCPDPAVELEQLYAQTEATVLMKTPGTLNGANILTDGKERTWLTDFADASLAPAFWNYVSLESVVRFDWANGSRLEWLHEMEVLLVGPEFVKFYMSGVEPPLRGTVRTIQHIRRLALRLDSRQEHAYQIGVLLHAVRRLVDHTPARQLANNELMRLAHVLFAVGMILDRVVVKHKNRATKTTRTAGIYIDQASRQVRIDGVQIHLKGQAYDLLHELYLHANESCSRATIVERLFGEKYEETNESQVSRLNTAIRRLREKIEADPDKPRFLITDSGVGYKLTPGRDG